MTVCGLLNEFSVFTLFENENLKLSTGLRRDLTSCSKQHLLFTSGYFDCFADVIDIKFHQFGFEFPFKISFPASKEKTIN